MEFEFVEIIGWREDGTTKRLYISKKEEVESLSFYTVPTFVPYSNTENDDGTLLYEVEGEQIIITAKFKKGYRKV